MPFESITLQTQEKYNLRDAMRTNSCGLEEWDFAKKLCYVLCANTPFIGEYVLSKNQFCDIVADGKSLFHQLVSQGTRPLFELEKRELTCAAIFLTQKMDEMRNPSEDDGQV